MMADDGHRKVWKLCGEGTGGGPTVALTGIAYGVGDGVEPRRWKASKHTRITVRMMTDSSRSAATSLTSQKIAQIQWDDTGGAPFTRASHIVIHDGTLKISGAGSANDCWTQTDGERDSRVFFFFFCFIRRCVPDNRGGTLGRISSIWRFKTDRRE